MKVFGTLSTALMIAVVFAVPSGRAEDSEISGLKTGAQIHGPAIPSLDGRVVMVEQWGVR